MVRSAEELIQNFSFLPGTALETGAMWIPLSIEVVYQVDVCDHVILAHICTNMK